MSFNTCSLSIFQHTLCPPGPAAAAVAHEVFEQCSHSHKKTCWFTQRLVSYDMTSLRDGLHLAHRNFAPNNMLVVSSQDRPSPEQSHTWKSLAWADLLYGIRRTPILRMPLRVVGSKAQRLSGSPFWNVQAGSSGWEQAQTSDPASARISS